MRMATIAAFGTLLLSLLLIMVAPARADVSAAWQSPASVDGEGQAA